MVTFATRFILIGPMSKLDIPQIYLAYQSSRPNLHIQNLVKTKAEGRQRSKGKLRRVRFHDLRHTFASLLLAQEESLAYVKDQMGHSSINVTVDVHGLVPGGNRAAVDKLDALPAKEKKTAAA